MIVGNADGVRREEVILNDLQEKRLLETGIIIRLGVDLEHMFHHALFFLSVPEWAPNEEF